MRKMEENGASMPVKEGKRQEFETFTRMNDTQRPSWGEASAGGVSLQALWPVFVKIQPSLSSLLQDLTEWHSSKFVQGPRSNIPQEISLDAGKPSSDTPKETGLDVEKPSLGITKETGEPSCIKTQEAGSNAGKQSFRIHQEIGLDAKKPNSDVAEETFSNTEKLSRDIPREIGSDAEKPSLGQTSLSPKMHQEIGSSGRTLQQVSVQIDDEDQSSSKTDEREEKIPFRERVHLFKAALIGEWGAAKSVLQNYSDAIRTPITSVGTTALHVAVSGNHTTFVEEGLKLMSPMDLELTDNYGYTIFFCAAASGNVNCAKEMVKMNANLPFMHNGDDDLPIHTAVQRGKRNMVRYLFSVTPLEQVTLLDRMNLFTQTIIMDMYDIGLEILRKDSTLATAKDHLSKTALEYLSEKPLAIGKTRVASCWKRYYNFGFKGAYNKALMQTFAHQLVEELWRQIQKLPEKQFFNLIDEQLFIFHTAAKLGNIEFLTIILRFYPEVVWRTDENEMNLLEVAILNRQESIFNLIYEIGDQKEFVTLHLDGNGNSMLHLVAQLAPPDRLNIIAGATLQLQRELIWFKEIEKIIPPTFTKLKNLEGKTAQGIFTKEHKQLCKDGEKWMKTTANNCMIVATLIATVVFATSVTVPGGNNQENGTPIFLESKWFLVFFISNAIALLSSSTSILIFLSILTSRYTEEDFFKSLPRRLVFGFIALFISIVGMLLAFGAICSLECEGELTWIPFVIIASASVPVIMFVLLHYDLWLDVIGSTYGSKFLFRPRKDGLFQRMKDDLKIDQ